MTLFPEMVRSGLNTSIIGRAVENGLIELETVNIRDYTTDKHGKVDDYTYGGGAGMLMQAQPVYDAWRAAAGAVRKLRTVYVTPQGRPFTQDYAAELAQEEELIFLCGHYEGIDQRVLDEIVTDYISIGDYVLTGGELPAMVMVDAISRLVPGVLHNGESAETETFHRSLLEYPQYSRPEIWHGKCVPEVLLSGDHRKISAWRMEQSVELTKERRPDLYAKYAEQEDVIRQLSGNKRLYIHMMENLRRGRGEVIYHQGGSVFLYDRSNRMGMLCNECGRKEKGSVGNTTSVHLGEEEDDKKAEAARRMIADIPKKILKEMELAVTTDETLNRALMEQLPLHVVSECIQACYTNRNPLPVRHKDIRLLDEKALGYLAEHYEHDGEEYLADRIHAGAMYGAFLNERLVGFAGWHSDGSLGFLYVEDDCRKQGIGASLEAFCINRQLERGFVPYGHIHRDNEISARMQERLGLYLSKESIWWLERNDI